jgi:hypothetical protein
VPAGTVADGSSSSSTIGARGGAGVGTNVAGAGTAVGCVTLTGSSILAAEISASTGAALGASELLAGSSVCAAS